MYTFCMEIDGATYGTRYEDAIHNCILAEALDSSVEQSIKGCYNSNEGILLEHQMATATPSDHTYVPWVVAYGVHNDTIQNAISDSLLDYVCANYTGTDKSSACPKEGYMSIPAPEIQVCPTEDALGSFLQ